MVSDFIPPKGIDQVEFAAILNALETIALKLRNQHVGTWNVKTHYGYWHYVPPHDTAHCTFRIRKFMTGGEPVATICGMQAAYQLMVNGGELIFDICKPHMQDAIDMYHPDEIVEIATEKIIYQDKSEAAERRRIERQGEPNDV